METILTVWQVQEWNDGELTWDRLFRDEVVARMAAIQRVHAYLMDDNAEVTFQDRSDNEWAWVDPDGDEYEIILGQREVQ